jgi:hypothetical protein
MRMNVYQSPKPKHGAHPVREAKSICPPNQSMARILSKRPSLGSHAPAQTSVQAMVMAGIDTMSSMLRERGVDTRPFTCGACRHLLWADFETPHY